MGAGWRSVGTAGPWRKWNETKVELGRCLLGSPSSFVANRNLRRQPSPSGGQVGGPAWEAERGRVWRGTTSKGHTSDLGGFSATTH